MKLRIGKQRKHSEGYAVNLFWDRFPAEDVLYLTVYGGSELEANQRARDVQYAMKDVEAFPSLTVRKSSQAGA